MSEREPPAVLGPDHSFDHGAVSGSNAWFFTAFTGVLDHSTRPHKTAAFRGLEAGTILEIGAGAGGSQPALRPPRCSLYAVEPSRRMHDRLRRRAVEAQVELMLLPSGAESIALPDASVDEAI